jgi:hypothetical protein
MGVDAAGGQHASQLSLVLVTRVDERSGQHAVAQTLLLAVDVAEEEVERGDPLDESGFQVAPLGGGDDAGNEVEGKMRSIPSFSP